jgi:arabinogalactan oligomer/maltooligosaccharide transport system permease protein
MSEKILTEEQVSMYTFKTKNIKKKNKEMLKHGMAHFILIIATLIAVFPILWIFSSSIRSTDTMFSSTLKLIPENPTLANYINIINQGDFLIWLRNSTIIASVTTVASIAIGLLGGYAFSRFRFRGRKFGLSLFLLLNAFPNILAMVAIYRLFDKLNFISSPIKLILIYTSWQVVFAIWNIKGYFDTLPREIEEAAFIDGASRKDVFLKILIPLSKPSLAVTALFAFLGSWNEYIFGITFVTDPKFFTLPMGLYNLQSSAGDYAVNWSLFSAGALLIALPITIVFLVLQRYLISGLTVGGVKG